MRFALKLALAIALVELARELHHCLRQDLLASVEHDKVVLNPGAFVRRSALVKDSDEMGLINQALGELAFDRLFPRTHASSSTTAGSDGKPAT